MPLPKKLICCVVLLLIGVIGFSQFHNAIGVMGDVTQLFSASTSQLYSCAGISYFSTIVLGSFAIDFGTTIGVDLLSTNSIFSNLFVNFYLGIGYDLLAGNASSLFVILGLHQGIYSYDFTVLMGPGFALEYYLALDGVGDVNFNAGVRGAVDFYSPISQSSVVWGYVISLHVGFSFNSLKKKNRNDPTEGKIFRDR